MLARARLLWIACLGGFHAGALRAAVACGVVAGAVVGPNWLWGIVTLLAVALRANTVLFLATAAFAWAAAWLAESALQSFGQWLLDACQAREVLALFGDDLAIALLNLDHYATAGKLVAGSGAAIAALLALAGLRRLANHRTFQADHSARRWAAAAWPRWLAQQLRGLAGDNRPRRPMRYFARGVLATVTSVAMVVVASRTARNPSRVAAWHDALAQAGIKISVGSAGYGAFSGRFEARDVLFSSHNDPDLTLQVDTLVAELRPGALWRGRCIVETAEARGVHASPALLAKWRACPGDSSPREHLATVLSQSTDDELHLPLAHLIADPERFQAWGQQLCAAIEAWNCVAGRTNLVNDRTPAPAPNTSPRATLFEQQGPIAIRRIRARELDPELGWGADATLHIQQLAGPAGQFKRAPRMLIISRAQHISCELELEMPGNASGHPVRFQAARLSLARCLPDTSWRQQHTLDGYLRLAATGTIDRQGLDLLVEAELTKPRANFAQGERWLGVDAQQWNDSLAAIDRIEGRARLRGPWNDAELQLDLPGWFHEISRQLLACNERSLAESLVAARAEWKMGVIAGMSREVPVSEISADNATLASNPDSSPPPGGAPNTAELQDESDIAAIDPLAGDGRSGENAGSLSAGEPLARTETPAASDSSPPAIDDIASRATTVVSPSNWSSGFVRARATALASSAARRPRLPLVVDNPHTISASGGAPVSPVQSPEGESNSSSPAESSSDALARPSPSEATAPAAGSEPHDLVESTDGHADPPRAFEPPAHSAPAKPHRRGPVVPPWLAPEVAQQAALRTGHKSPVLPGPIAFRTGNEQRESIVPRHGSGAVEGTLPRYPNATHNATPNAHREAKAPRDGLIGSPPTATDSTSPTGETPGEPRTSVASEAAPAMAAPPLSPSPQPAAPASVHTGAPAAEPPPVEQTPVEQTPVEQAAPALADSGGSTTRPGGWQRLRAGWRRFWTGEPSETAPTSGENLAAESTPRDPAFTADARPAPRAGSIRR